MDKRGSVIKRGIEQSLWGRPIDLKKNKELSSSKTKKAAMRVMTGIILFPVVGIIGALLIWTVIRLVLGLPGYPGIH